MSSNTTRSSIITSALSLPSASPPNLVLKSFSASSLLIGSIVIRLRYLIKFRASSSLRVVTRIDLYGHYGRYDTSDRKFSLSMPLICLSYPILRASTRKPVSSTLLSIRAYFPFFSSHSQSYTSWKILAVKFCRPGSLTRSAISRKLCSNRTVLLT
jgi:hypothetical protein